jgi:NAD(P)H-dependent FMN reductase
MATFFVPVIYGSVRRERQGIKAARYVVNRLKSRGHEPVLIDPLEHQLPLLDRMYKEFPPGTAPAVMEELAGIFRRADGFVIVTGEYNHATPPALSNMLDHFLEEFFWRPALLVSYSGGRWGGTRAAYTLRSTLSELGMVTMPSELPIANIAHAFDDEGNPADARMDEFTKTGFEELEWFMNIMKPARAAGTPY